VGARRCVRQNQKINKRYIRNAIDDAIGNIKTAWVNTKLLTKKTILNNKELSDRDKHYLFTVLKVGSPLSTWVILK
jgi:hypothetical protein